MFLTVSVLVVLAAALTWLLTRPYKPDLYVKPEAARTAHQVKHPTYDIPRKVLVTGGCGFLGSRIVDVLVAQGCEVTVFDLRGSVKDPRVRVIHGDLTDKASVAKAFKGQELVFHCASPPPALNNAKLFHDVNVTGTQHVVDCCIEAGIGRLVFTSSASVVYDGTNQVNVDETLPFPKSFRDVYCKTKAQAEHVALEGGHNSGGKLTVIAVRPHGIFGPGDPQLVPTVVEQAKRGKMKFAIGPGDNLVDFTYVGNVVHGHMLAAVHAKPGPAANQPFFITNDEPVTFWGFLSSILVGLKYKPPSRRLPYRFILGLSHIASSVAGLMGKTITFSPSRMQLAGTHHYYNCNKAKALLGYKPLWSVAEGLALNLEAFRKLVNPKEPQLVFTERPFAAEEVAEHASPDDLWVIIDGKVFDLSEYVEYHPGGDAILRHAGGDATLGFHGKQHPSSVFETVDKFQIGVLKK